MASRNAMTRRSWFEVVRYACRTKTLNDECSNRGEAAYPRVLMDAAGFASDATKVVSAAG